MNSEDRKLLESIVKVHNRFLKGCKKETITPREIQAIENLLKENEHLKDELDTQKRANGLLLAENEMHRKKDLEETKKIEKELMTEILETGLIAKIKEKIEELDGKSGGNTYHVQSILNAQKRILQELLEGK